MLAILPELPEENPSNFFPCPKLLESTRLCLIIKSSRPVAFRPLLANLKANGVGNRRIVAEKNAQGILFEGCFNLRFLTNLEIDLVAVENH